MNIGEAVALRGELDSYERQENLWILEHILNRNALELKLLGDLELSSKQQQDYIRALALLTINDHSLIFLHAVLDGKHAVALVQRYGHDARVLTLKWKT